MLRRTLALFLLLTLVAAAQSATPAATPAAPTTPPAGPATLMTPELLWKLGRLGGADVSKDGRHVVYTVRNYELKENKGTTDLFIYDVTVGKTRTLLKAWPSIGNLQFGTSPFGERIFMIGTTGKGEKEKPQAFAVNPQDGAILQLTEVEDGVGNLKVSPTGKHLAFTVDIKLDKEVNELYKDLPKADARIIDSLMFRHWNAWHDFKYSHLHVAPVQSDGKAGKATDLMKDRKVDCPVPPFGGNSQIAWSPDGTRLAFVMKDQPRWAETTNSDVYLLNVKQPQAITNVSQGYPGYDMDPVWSPDGKKLAFHSMARDGFESDRNRIMIKDFASGQITEATEGLDQTVHGAKWFNGGFLFSGEFRGTTQVFKLQNKTATQISKGRYNWTFRKLFPDQKRALVSFSRMERPDELAILDLGDGSSKTITKINDEHYRHLQLPKVEERWVTATDGKKIHCWVVYPPNFDPNKKWPMLTYCQGGPQAMIGQWFSYRWNFHLMAANGYVVLAPNRRGLPGFGREWNDDISGDWGGQPMKDLLSATDALTAEPYIDNKRVAAIGASYGGYTVYWMMGNHQDRFATMVAHCGVFNLEAMYGSTEELFFVNWDLGGPYWKSPELKKKYDQFSPHRFVGNWKTPLLIIHGEKDFRIPSTQGMEAFTAAQVQGVPSRFLYYPEEGHWVLGAQNGVLWHRVFFDWLNRYCGDSKSQE